MLIKRSELEKILANLIDSLEHVKHVGLLLIWLWEYLQNKYASAESPSEVRVSRSSCRESLPRIYRPLLDALAMFRNAYVHQGPKATVDAVLELRSMDPSVVQDLFTLAEVPENACILYWKWLREERCL